ncbi:MAG: polysaccharide biosynthesis tyrosine autokinase [Acidobacteriaceae bacterium]
MKDQLTLQSLWAILHRRRRVVYWSLAVWVILGALVCIIMTPRYRTIGVIEVAKQSSDGLGLQSMMPTTEAPSDAIDTNITLQTQVNILQSDSLALGVIEKLNLEQTYDFRPYFNPIAWLIGLISLEGPKDPQGASLENSPHRRARAIDIFQRRLKVESVAGTRLIEIKYLSSSRKDAADVVNELIRELLDYSFNARTSVTAEGSHWLEGQLDQVKGQAEQLQAKVVDLQRQSGMYSLGVTDANGLEAPPYSATLNRLQQTTEALAQATSNRILKGAIAQMVETGDPEMISGLAGASMSSGGAPTNNSFNLIQSLRSQQAALQVQIAADQSKYGSANPKLSDDRMALASITSAINQEVRRIRDRARNDYHTAQVAENDLKAVYEEQRAAADKLNDKAIEYSIAKQEATESRNLYDTLFRHLKEAGVMERLRSSNITVVDPGRIPDKPARPNVPIYMGAAVFAGLLFGSMGALFFETTDDRLQIVDHLERDLSIPALGVILPLTLRSREKRPLLLRSSDSPLALLEGPRSPFAEALRGVRTAVLFQHGKTPRTILITSPSESEGKTTVALNLGAVMSQNGARVLLVEADMRRPRFSEYLGTDGEAGLSDLLQGSTERFQRAPFKDLPSLDVLPSGLVPQFPSELLGSPRMRELVEEWSDAYDVVLFDSPPTLVVTDATVLSKVVDSTLLIARYSQTTRPNLQRAYKMLHGHTAGHVSVLVNGADPSSAPWVYEYSRYQT